MMVSERFQRQALFYGVGPEGQRRLQASRVAVMGCGALGSVLASILVRAGVGFLRIVDRDFIERSNLQRQMLFDEEDIAKNLPKAVAAAEKLRAANPEAVVEARVADLNPATVEALCEGVDLVLDGLDNFEARYVLNDACVKRGLPWIYAAALGSHGLTMVVRPGQTPCLRCLFPDPPAPGTVETCDTAGVIGPGVGVVASYAAAEALKLLVGAEEKLHRGLLWIDVWENGYQHTPLDGPLPGCPSCQERRFEFLNPRQATRTADLCGRNAVQIVVPGQHALSLADLAARLGVVGRVVVNEHMLRCALGEHELVVFPDGRAIVKGTTDPAVARGLYARYVGL
ncbi:MAG TPA: ThiF family adenylyltransferase [Chloroflexota bacterium]